jgi:hypothetical protein
MIGVSAPVIPDQNEDGVCPGTAGDDCINALPREVLAVCDVCGDCFNSVKLCHIWEGGKLGGGKARTASAMASILDATGQRVRNAIAGIERSAWR